MRECGLVDISESLSKYQDLIFGDNIASDLKLLGTKIQGVSDAGKSVWLFGNGASASIASHVALDLTKQSGVRAKTFSDNSMVTALANDFGYENWMSKALEYYSSPNDLVILISVSGDSPSICRALDHSKYRGIEVVGFSGRHPTNYLNSNSNMGLHVPSHSYNLVENVHSIWLTAVVDYLVGSDTYEVS